MESLKNTLLRQNKHWQRDYKRDKYISRQLVKGINFDSKFIKIISGVRRSGKSSILNILIDQLIFDKKVSPQSILFLNFDSFVFIPCYKRVQNLYEIIKQAEVLLNRKIYCVNNGLINQVAFNFSKDEGKLLEN